MEDMKKNSDPGINGVLTAAIDLNPSVPNRLEKNNTPAYKQQTFKSCLLSRPIVFKNDKKYKLL